MAYNITLTNSTPLVTISDGTEDTTHTNLTLVGRNYAGYGTALNENFVKLLENFSNSTAPTTPLIGQLWWDSTNGVLKAWQGTSWKALASSITTSSIPASAQLGDLWFNPVSGSFSGYNGTTWITIGPSTPVGAAVTSIGANVAVDTLSGTHIVGNITVNNKLSGIFSTESAAFTLLNSVSGLTVINPGLNVAGTVAATANVQATNVFATANVQAGNVTATNFVNAASITTTTASFGNVVQGNLTVTGATALSGTSTAPTPTNGDNSTKIATTAFVTTTVNTIVAASVGTLGNMSTQVANAVAIVGGTITGTTINTYTVGSNATGTKTVSTSAPSGGSNGDIWYQVAS
jgi:hypothetical protein